MVSSVIGRPPGGGWRWRSGCGRSRRRRRRRARPAVGIGPVADGARAGRRRGRGSGSGRSGAGSPALRRSAPGSAARRRSRSSRRAGRPSRSRVRDAFDSSAMRAPVPAALPIDRTCARSQSGMSPRTIAWRTSMWLPKAPASRISSTASTPRWSISSRAPGVQGGLRELDGADVVLGDGRPRRAVVEHVGEGPAVGDDPRRAGRQVAVDGARPR